MLNQVRALLFPEPARYAPVPGEEDDDLVRRPIFVRAEDEEQQSFSWWTWWVFCSLGIAMLWAW